MNTLATDGNTTGTAAPPPAAPQRATHFVKARRIGERVWYFVTPRGGLNLRRVHAARMSEANALGMARHLADDNPEYETKVVLID